MKVILYSKDNCVKCNQAKMLLDIKSIPYELKMLGVDYDRDEAIDISGGKIEMPIVTVDGKYIGGLLSLKEVIKMV